jgi:hypothetical protein
MRKIALIAFLLLTCWFASDWARAADLKIPENAVAGEPLTIATSGSGAGTLILVGPGEVIKRSITLGESAEIKPEELQHAGRWIAIVRGGDRPQSQAFWVNPGKPDQLSFLARPSRVPVNRPGVISGVAFVFDKNRNLVLQPASVEFSLAVGGSGAKQSVKSSNGVAWIKSSSAKKAGAAQFIASAGDGSVRRVVQQVASDPCERTLRMRVEQKNKEHVILVTDPIRDCTGNPVPDGTIVTFIETDKTGKSVVDARIKKGIARAELPASENANVTIAAGVVLGNELHIGGGE